MSSRVLSPGLAGRGARDMAVIISCYEPCVHTSSGHAGRKHWGALMRKALVLAVTGHRTQGGSPLVTSCPPRPGLPCALCQLRGVLGTLSPHAGPEQGQGAPGWSRPLTFLFGSCGVLRRKSLRTRQSSEDVYFSKSGETWCPPCPPRCAHRPP